MLRKIAHQGKLMIQIMREFESHELISAVEQFVRSNLMDIDCSHDWNHICRVRSNVHKILKAEQEAGRFLEADPLVLEVSALMHDVGDFKYTKDHTAGPRIVREFLNLKMLSSRTSQIELINAEQIEKICQIVSNISFRHELANNEMYIELPEELLIVQDADRLDAIGAIGIARCFAYCGATKRPFYNETTDKIRVEALTAEMYNLQTLAGGKTATALGHFDEKLFKLKDIMKTETGRELAAKRHNFMLEFVAIMRSECDL